MSKYIGSRQLTSSEAKLILPTYDQIFEQIKEIRQSAIDLGRNANIQKTNNIGILGCRGAGKTSVLKTIANTLAEQEENNIILPIIIPENMSSSSTLMATILGLFKSVVEKIEQKPKNKNCISEGDNSLSKKYIEVIKQYTYIQKEYRDILINEFTSENEYVKKSKEIFNSDIEFINKFNEFIDLFVEKKDKVDTNTLIFLFIDDIDLSTRRCTDVIKTLLSYVCHKNIVTFISGDLDTFEEALTIDFLRQEEALSNKVWDGGFLGTGDTLLESKKRLAYEYLKKVVPPIYRYNIKSWSIEDRGNYVINPDGKVENPNLSELLSKVLKSYINRSYFKIIDYTNNEAGKEENLIYTYHIFDHTSRGINNVYNVLLSIYQKNNREANKISFEDKKMLIETIASSKEVYNRYRRELFENIISFGSDEESTFIRFENLKALLDKDDEITKYNIKEKSKNNKDDGNIIKDTKAKKNIMNEVEKFQMFVLIDFAARLLSTEEKKFDITNIGNGYNEVKKDIIKLLIQNPLISGSNYKLKKTFDFESGEESKKEVDKNINLTYKDIVTGFLVKGDFDLSMSIYNNLTTVSYEIHNFYISNMSDNQGKFREYLWYIYNAIKSCASLQTKETKTYIGDVYEVLNVEFAYIQSNLSDNKLVNSIMSIYGSLFDNYTIKDRDGVRSSFIDKWTQYKEENVGKTPSDESINNTIDYNIRRLYFNTLAKHLERKFFDSNGEINQIERNMNGIKNIDNIIYNINKNDLWEHSITEKIKDGLIRKIDKEITNIQESVVIDIHNMISKSYSDFKKIYKGKSSNTKAKVVEGILENTLNNENIEFAEFCFVKEIIRRLATNNRVSYGQYEAQKMINDFNEAIIISQYIGNEELMKILYYYGLFIIKDLEIKNIYRQSSDLSEFKKDISESQSKVNTNMITDYMKQINEGIQDDITIEYLENLF